MSLGAGIYAFLSDNLTVGERVYPLVLPQNAELPAVVYQGVADDALLTHDDAQDHPLYDVTTFEQTRVQFSCWADNYDDAEALGAELLVLLKGYRGFWGTVDVRGVLPELWLDDYEPETQKYRQIRDFIISWIGGADAS